MTTWRSTHAPRFVDFRNLHGIILWHRQSPHKTMELKRCCFHKICYGGSRWGSMGSVEPPFCLKFTLNVREMASPTFQILKFSQGSMPPDPPMLVAPSVFTNLNPPSLTPGSGVQINSLVNSFFHTVMHSLRCDWEECLGS